MNYSDDHYSYTTADNGYGAQATVGFPAGAMFLFSDKLWLLRYSRV
jgi:hypothetical protein